MRIPFSIRLFVKYHRFSRIFLPMFFVYFFFVFPLICIPLKKGLLSANQLFHHFSVHLEKEAIFGLFLLKGKRKSWYFLHLILKGRQVLAVLVFSREMSAQFLCRPPRCLTQAAQRAAFIFQIGMKCVLFLQIPMFIFCTKK